MNKLKILFWFLLFIAAVPVQGQTADFDGSKPLLCVPIEIRECSPGAECQSVTAESINLSQFLRIDFAEKKISNASEVAAERHSVIKNMEQVDGKLILQGAEDGIEGVRDGLGWTMAIAQDTGKMVISASGDQVGFIIFGACTPR